MSKKFINGIEIDGAITKTGGTANQILNADGTVTEKTNSALRQVTYAASVTDAYNEAQPNFYIDLTGDITLAISGITSGGGIVNLNRSTGNEIITLTGTKSGSHVYPTGVNDVIRLTYSFEQGAVVWGCENSLSAAAPVTQTVAGTGTSNIDFANGTIVKLNLGSQDEVLTITDPIENTEVVFLVKQDSVGNRTITLPARFGGIGDTVIASLSSTANAVDYVAYSFIDGIYYPKPIIQDIQFADIIAPTAPTSLTSSALTDTTLTLTWVAATDNTAVTGYKVYQDAVEIASLGNVLTYDVTGLTASTLYSFTVTALDAGGNESVASTALNITTETLPVKFLALTLTEVIWSLYGSDDGTKMYVGDNGSIKEYTMSTAGEISTGTLTGSFTITDRAVGMKILNGGTKLIWITHNENIRSATLSTAWDLDTATDDGITFSVATETTSASGLSVSEDGTKLFVNGATGNLIYSYTMSTPNLVSSLSYDTFNYFVSGISGIQDNHLKKDGTTMYVIANGSNDISTHTLSTANDLSTASSANDTLSISAQEVGAYGLYINDAGIKAYIGGNGDTIYQYTIGTPFIISTGTY